MNRSDSFQQPYPQEWCKEVSLRVQRNSLLRNSGWVPSPNKQSDTILTQLWKEVASFLCFEGSDSSSHCNPQSPHPLRQISPLKASLLNPAGFTWQLKSHGTPSGPKCPGRDFRASPSFQCPPFSPLLLYLAVKSLCWKGWRHRFTCSFIHSTVLTCLLFYGCGIKHWGCQRVEKGHLFLKNSYSAGAQGHVTKPQQCGNVKIGSGT